MNFLMFNATKCKAFVLYTCCAERQHGLVFVEYRVSKFVSNLTKYMEVRGHNIAHHSKKASQIYLGGERRQWAALSKKSIPCCLVFFEERLNSCMEFFFHPSSPNNCSPPICLVLYFLNEG